MHRIQVDYLHCEIITYCDLFSNTVRDVYNS